MDNEKEFLEAQERIEKAVKAAEDTVMAKLKSANALITDVKSQMAHGTDCITTPQIQEWAIVIPIICEELTPAKEAFDLTKSLWDIETKQLQAKNLLELDMKKTEIEQVNKLAGTENSKKKAIAEYIRNMLAGTQESLWMLGNALRKILDARIANREAK